MTNLELQARDIAALTDLRNLTVLSLDQLRRLHWANTSRESCRKRLSRLMNQGERWLDNFTVAKPEMRAAGLQPGQVYHLSAAGRAWFRGRGGAPGRLPRQRQALHDLLVSEFYVRLVEAAREQGGTVEWRADWQVRFYRREADERPLLVPDGLAIVSGLRARPVALFVELDYSREGHRRPSSRIGRKIGGYDAYQKVWSERVGLEGVDYFPGVVFLTHGAQRLENVAASIVKHRRQPVGYGLALTGEVMAAEEPLGAALWRLIPPEAGVLSPPASLLDEGWLAQLRRNRRPAAPRVPPWTAAQRAQAAAASPTKAARSGPSKPARPTQAAAASPTKAAKPTPSKPAQPTQAAAASPAKTARLGPSKPAQPTQAAAASPTKTARPTQAAAASPAKTARSGPSKPAPSKTARPTQAAARAKPAAAKKPGAATRSHWPILGRAAVAPASAGGQGWLSSLRQRLSRTPQTGCEWADRLLAQAEAVGLEVAWQPLPGVIEAVFDQVQQPPPAGRLLLAGYHLFVDADFGPPVVQARLAAYRETAYVWSEQGLQPGLPQWVLAAARLPSQALAVLQAAQSVRRVVGLAVTTEVALAQSEAAAEAAIWQALPQIGAEAADLLAQRPLLAVERGVEKSG